jgi:uncharacterized protein YukE
MSSDPTGRYAGVSHQTLYDQLKAGDPEQVDGLATHWSTMSSTLSDVSRPLATDLARLAGSWEGSSGTEFQRRLTLVANYADSLSEEYSRVGEGLALQSNPLRAAQAQAEHPDETDDNDQMWKGVAKGSVAGVPGMVIGGVFGHNKDEEEQEKAHQRMVKLVAGLAVTYEENRLNSWAVPVTDIPDDLPGQTTDGGYSSTSTGAPGAPRTMAATGLGGPKADAGIATPTNASDGPGQGSGGPGGPGHSTTTPGTDFTPGTSLSGADGTAGPGAGHSEALPGTGVGTGPGSGSGGSGSGGLLSNGAGLALGVGLLAGGAAILGGRPAMGGSAAAGSGGNSMSGTRPGTNSMSSTGRAGGAGGGETARTASAKPSAGSGESARSANAAGRGMPGKGGAVDLGVRQGDNRGGAAGGRGAQGEDETDERTTWLTEDEMVWQGRDQAAPPVLGG